MEGEREGRKEKGKSRSWREHKRRKRERGNERIVKEKKNQPSDLQI